MASDVTQDDFLSAMQALICNASTGNRKSAIRNSFDALNFKL
jgi:hypothetical protein